MGDFEDKLNQILSSPETMGKIMSLASSLQGENQDPSSQQTQMPTGQADPPVATPASNDTGQAGLEGLRSALGNLDPGVVQTIGTLFREYNRGQDEKTALLAALRPFLQQERRERLDKAIQMARISRVIRAALKLFQGGDGNV